MQLSNKVPSYKVHLFFLAFLGLITLPIGKLLTFAFSPNDSQSTKSVIILVNKGENPNDLTRMLVSENIVSDGRTMIWLGRLTRKWKSIKAGEYQVSPNMTPLEIFRTLSSGISVLYPITIREGENMYEVADDLQVKGLAKKEQFVALCKNIDFIRSLGVFREFTPRNLEGYLFPDTYFFNHSTPVEEMVKRMVRHFFDYWSKEQDDRAHELKLSRHEVITLASMIEKETGAPEERKVISSVFHNRLKKRIKLQSDPTTIYGMWKRYEGKIHKSDLSEKNEYNTYYIRGLPIGPIGNPGKEAIQAALYPIESPYFFFVSHNNGTHQFSRTIEEHNRAVAKYQLDPRAREGKSWRDFYNKNHLNNGNGTGSENNPAANAGGRRDPSSKSSDSDREQHP